MIGPIFRGFMTGDRPAAPVATIPTSYCRKPCPGCRGSVGSLIGMESPDFVSKPSVNVWWLDLKHWILKLVTLMHMAKLVPMDLCKDGRHFHEHGNIFGKLDAWRPSTSGGCRSNASSPLPSPRPPSSPLLVSHGSRTIWFLGSLWTDMIKGSREKIHGYWGLGEMVCQAHPYPGAMIWNRQYHRPMRHIRSRDNWGLIASMRDRELGYRRTLQLHWRMLPWSHA